MAEIYLTIVSGQTVSSMAVLPRLDRPLAVYCSSMASQQVQFQFAPTSGGTFATLWRSTANANGYETVVMSASAGWTAPVYPLTPFMRIQLLGSAGATTSYMIVQQIDY